MYRLNFVEKILTELRLSRSYKYLAQNIVQAKQTKQQNARKYYKMQKINDSLLFWILLLSHPSKTRATNVD
jgi:hypothetical protein